MTIFRFDGEKNKDDGGVSEWIIEPVFKTGEPARPWPRGFESHPRRQLL